MRPIGMEQLRPPRAHLAHHRKCAKAETNQELAYHMRVEGRTWQAIADKLGYENRSRVIQAVKLYAIRNNKPQLCRVAQRRPGGPTRSEQAYYMRKFGHLTWQEIANRLGFASHSAACQAGYLFAANHHYERPPTREELHPE